MPIRRSGKDDFFRRRFLHWLENALSKRGWYFDYHYPSILKDFISLRRGRYTAVSSALQGPTVYFCSHQLETLHEPSLCPNFPQVLRQDHTSCTLRTVQGVWDDQQGVLCHDFPPGPVWEKWEILENEFLKSKLISAGFYKGLKWLSQHFSSSFLHSLSTLKNGQKITIKKKKLRKNKLKKFIFLSSIFIKNERHWGKGRDNFLAQSKGRFGTSKYLPWEVMTSSEFTTCLILLMFQPHSLTANAHCSTQSPGAFAEAAGTQLLSGSNRSPPSTALQPCPSPGSGLLKCKWV